MKLLLIAPFPPTKAPEVDHAVYLCNKLAAAGVDVHVLTKKQSKSIIHPRVTVHPDLASWSWYSLPNLALRLRLYAPDVVMLLYLGWAYNYHPMITFVPTISKKILPRTRFVTLVESHYGVDPRYTFDGCVIRGPSSRLDRRIYRAVSRFMGLRGRDFGANHRDGDLGTLLRDSDHLIVVSERIHKILMARLPCVSSKTTVIPTPPLIRILPEDEGRVRRAGRERLGIRPEEFVLGYFGYTYPGKGVETLLRAFSLVSRGIQKVRLLLVGGSLKMESNPRYTEELHELVTQLAIDEKVIWTGEYPAESDDASRHLRAADACVLPFDSGVCIHNSSFATAAAHGLPVITTRPDSLEEAFVDGENVLLCPPRDPEAMAALIEILINRPELQRRLHTGSLAMAQEWFSWDKSIERTIAACSGGRQHL
jgi:glycosyltransferase involved in cell wall biosynthesis